MQFKSIWAAPCRPGVRSAGQGWEGMFKLPVTKANWECGKNNNMKVLWFWPLLSNVKVLWFWPLQPWYDDVSRGRPWHARSSRARTGDRPSPRRWWSWGVDWDNGGIHHPTSHPIAPGYAYFPSVSLSWDLLRHSWDFFAKTAIRHPGDRVCPHV